MIPNAGPSASLVQSASSQGNTSFDEIVRSFIRRPSASIILLNVAVGLVFFLFNFNGLLRYAALHWSFLDGFDSGSAYCGTLV